MNAGAAMTTVLLVDDHRGFRAQARRLLEADGYSVVGEAADGAAAMAAIRSLRPDLVLLDVCLTDEDGIEVARSIGQIEAPPPVILISSREAAAYGPRIAASGARGFVTKEQLSGPAIEALIGEG
jgi:DNA-binding NarL/FixJ family response regulator